MSTTVGGAPLSIAEARKTLEAIHTGLSSLYDEIVADHRRLAVCRGFQELQRAIPRTHLDKARARLDRRSYRIGFAGGFSAGKSTLVNALFGAPDMLPAEAGECTMSITLVSAPPTGVEEHVEVRYFAREDAIRFVLTNERYHALFAPRRDEIQRGVSAERGTDLIREAIDRPESSSDDRTGGEPKRELTEFLTYLKELGPRLGTTHMDRIEAAPRYLTTASDNSGLGHLLCIEQVHLFRHTPLFNERGVEIVDLPGSDSTNERQRELTYKYLAEADAIMLAIEPRGISMEGRNIWERLSRHNSSIRNKMFFILNKFDTLGVADLRKEPLEKLLKGQVLEKLATYNLDPRKLFLTSAKLADLEARRRQGRATPGETEELASMLRDCQSKRSALDPATARELLPLIDRALQDGAIGAVREALVRYLEWDIQIERLREVYADLEQVHAALKKLLDLEEPRVRELKSRLRSRSSELNEFFEQAKGRLFDAISVVPKGLDMAVKAGTAQAKDDLRRRVTGAIDSFNFQRVLLKMRVPSAMDVKLEVIARFKKELSERFAETLRDGVAPLILSKLKTQLEESRVAILLDRLSADLGSEHGKRQRALAEGFEQGLLQLTFMRALESTWPLQDADMRPTGYEPAWTDTVEKDFKQALKDIFVQRLVDAAQALEPVLARHYRQLVIDLLERYERLMDEVLAEVKRDPDRVRLPVEVLRGDDEGSKEVEAQQALLRYADGFAQLQRLVGQVPEAIRRFRDEIPR